MDFTSLLNQILPKRSFSFWKNKVILSINLYLLPIFNTLVLMMNLYLAQKAYLREKMASYFLILIITFIEILTLELIRFYLSQGF